MLATQTHVYTVTDKDESMYTFSQDKVNKQAKYYDSIKYRYELQEFEIQAYLFVSLLRMGYLVRGEVVGKKSRMDLVIYHMEGKRLIPARIIEVKKAGCSMGIGKQRKRYYVLHGVPVDVVKGISRAHKYLRKITTILPLTTDCSILSKSGLVFEGEYWGSTWKWPELVDGKIRNIKRGSKPPVPKVKRVTLTHDEAQARNARAQQNLEEAKALRRQLGL